MRKFAKDRGPPYDVLALVFLQLIRFVRILDLANVNDTIRPVNQKVYLYLFGSFVDPALPRIDIRFNSRDPKPRLDFGNMPEANALKRLLNEQKDNVG